MTGLGPVTVFWLSAVLLVSDGGRLPPHWRIRSLHHQMGYSRQWKGTAESW
jgi:hypothetical protein